MNSERIVFFSTTASLALLFWWMLTSTPEPRERVLAHSEGDWQESHVSQVHPVRDIAGVLEQGVNPFALPAEVKQTQIIGPDGPQINPDPNPNDVVIKPNENINPPPPPPPDKPDNNPNTNNQTTVIAPPRYQWPVQYNGVSQIGAKRYVHVSTREGKTIMAFEGDTLEVINKEGIPEKVSIVAISPDRIRIRNQEGFEEDMAFDRLKFKGTVFPDDSDETTVEDKDVKDTLRPAPGGNHRGGSDMGGGHGGLRPQPLKPPAR
ncbi:MAG: hypothetical protein ABIH86_06720 [Planctomycetota bacterium]